MSTSIILTITLLLPVHRKREGSPTYTIITLSLARAVNSRWYARQTAFMFRKLHKAGWCDEMLCKSAHVAADSLRLVVREKCPCSTQYFQALFDFSLYLLCSCMQSIQLQCSSLPDMSYDAMLLLPSYTDLIAQPLTAHSD